MTARVHDTALVEDGVEIGDGTAIWDNVHIRAPSRIGADCIVGEKSYIAYGVTIADRVKINAFVYICFGVTIGTGVFIGAGTTFTNDRFPRACTPDLDSLLTSEPTEDTQRTYVREGASIGSGALVGCDLEIGRFAMVGMGALVTRSVPAFHLVVGQPAKSIGYVCRCGAPVLRFTGKPPSMDPTDCERCGRTYVSHDGLVEECVPAGRSVA